MPGTLKLKSEAGGSVILAANTTAASDLTVTVPASSGTMVVSPQLLTVPNTAGTVMVSGNMPAFSVYLSGVYTLSTTSTWTKLPLNTKYFDTASCYDTTNYRFTPNVAGYYQVNLYTTSAAVGAGTPVIGTCVYKNGSIVGNLLQYSQAYSGGYGGLSVSVVMYLNGTTDYIEMYAYTTLSAYFYSNGPGTGFSASLVRSA